MKKFLLLLLIVGGSVYAYFWYVRGINLLQREDPNPLPTYGAAVHVPPKVPAKATDLSTYRWYAAEKMPTPRTAVGAAAIGTHIYVVGGVDGFDRTVANLDMYDTRNNTWTSLHPLPRPAQKAATIAFNGKLYVFGGFEGLAENPLDSVFIYDPGTDSWTNGKKMGSALGGSAVVVADGKIHLFGGKSVGTDVDTHAVYDPVTDSWSGSTELNIGKERLSALLLGRKIYLFGGRQGSLVYNVDAVDAFDLDRNVWETVSLMPRKRSDLVALEFEGKAYIFGGEAPTVTFDEVDVFDPTNDRWSTLETRMPDSRHGLGGAVVDGEFFLIAGGQRSGLSVSDLNQVFAPPAAAAPAPTPDSPKTITGAAALKEVPPKK